MASLVLGAFQMIASDGSARVLAEGTSWGSPVPIEVAINTFLQDGAIVVTQGYDNREINIKVRFYGDDLTALATKEAALFLELGKPNTLTWTPTVGPVSVFDVVTSSLVQDDESFVGDVQTKPWRSYSVRLTCEAFTRSATETVTAALAGGGTTTNNVDTMGATTGWTATVNAGVPGTVVNAAGPPTTNSVTQSAAYGSFAIAMTKTVSVTTTSLKYLIVDWKPSPSGMPGGAGFTSGPLVATGDGTALPRVAEINSPTAGYLRTTFYVAAASLGTLVLSWTSNQPNNPSWSAQARVLTLDNIAISDVRPVIGSAHQQLRSLAVSGSARTQGALAVESTVSLGDTIVYVYPDDATTRGYVPALRPYRTAGNTVTGNSALISGASESITGSGVTYQVPVTQLPASLYTLMFRVLTTGTTPTVTWTVKTTLGGVDTNTKTGTFNVPAASYTIYTLARVMLPTTVTGPGSPAVVTINLTASTTCELDEAWLFSSIGQLTVVNCGTATAAVGGPAKRLFLEPATVDTPRPTILMGHSADRSDAYSPGTALVSWQPPVFPPGVVNVLTVTAHDTATDSTVALRHYLRWHTNPAS